MRVRIGVSKRGGRGVFALMALPRGIILDRAPVLVCPARDDKALERAAVGNYTFLWPDGKRNAVAFGVISLVNHSQRPNADFVFDIERLEALLFTKQRIKEGDEILIDYGRKPWW